VGHVPHIGDEKCMQYFENLKGRDCLEDLGGHWRIILEWILREHCGKLWTGFIWIRIWSSGRFL